MTTPRCSDFQIGVFVMMAIMCTVFATAAFDRPEVEMLRVQLNEVTRAAADHAFRIYELELKMDKR